MRTYINPSKKQWEEIAKRPVFEQKDIEPIVSAVLQDVKHRGDVALIEYTAKFDGWYGENFAVSEQELAQAEIDVNTSLKEAIKRASENITKFHNAQKEKIEAIETGPGVSCWRKSIAIERVGLYIPGGTAPLFSSVLMLAIPAKIAGCKEIVLCSPAPNGIIHPAVLYAAKHAGVTKVYKLGGSQAIAAMAFGTKTVPSVYKIFGPGNQFVTKAKQMVTQHGLAIDMPAGPSEVLIIADASANPVYVAADMLSQAEHGNDSQAVLLTNSHSIISAVKEELNKQLLQLPRAEFCRKSLENSKLVYFEGMTACMDFSNYYAPEHLILATDSADELVHQVVNAGSVFIGHYSCESAGDYASGTNHTLPTNGYAKAYSGVSLDSFVKKITFQKLTREGLCHLGPVIMEMAKAEQLEAHSKAVELRLNNTN
ncbi:MAG: histidinol dehydrogenase [Flavobacteriales bacterium]